MLLPFRLHSAVTRLILWLARQRQRRALGELAPRLLDDVGLTREQVEAERRKWRRWD